MTSTLYPMPRQAFPHLKGEHRREGEQRRGTGRTALGVLRSELSDGGCELQVQLGGLAIEDGFFLGGHVSRPTRCRTRSSPAGRAA